MIFTDVVQKKHVNFVVNHIGRNYLEMARYLEISDRVLDYIKADNPHDSRERVRAIMRKWIEENGHCVTISKLCDVLATIRKIDRVENLTRL